MANKEVEINNPEQVAAIVFVGGIWRVASVELQPEIRLAQWCIREIQPAGTRHFVGWSLEGEGRVSSAIVEFDPKRLRGITESGRVYELDGKAGYNADAEYVFTAWRRIPGQGAETVRDVTYSVLAAIANWQATDTSTAGNSLPM